MVAIVLHLPGLGLFHQMDRLLYPSHYRPGIAVDTRGTGVVVGQQQIWIQTMLCTAAGYLSDCVVPTLPALRHSTDIQAQMNACLQELEQANRINTAGTGDSSVVVQDSSKKGCSVNKLGNEKKVSVAWSRDLAFVGTLRKRPQYEHLTHTQWILGFLCIAQGEICMNI